MEYRTLGRTGVKVAAMGLGTDNFANPTPAAECGRIMRLALDSGLNLIDTSNSYAKGESERIIGDKLAAWKMRNRVILATKVHYPTGDGPNDSGNSRLHIFRACEESLRRLRTDYIDLYQLHRPSFDIHTEETLGALTDLVRQGKVRYIGSSTAPAWKVAEAVVTSDFKGYARFVSEQPPYNLLDRRIENELIPMCRALNLGLLPWSPMAMGLLAGRYESAQAYPAHSRARLRGGIFAERITRRGIAIGQRFATLARKLGVSAAQLAVLWVKEQQGVTAPLIGPRTFDQLKHLLPVLGMTLPPDIRRACDELVPPGSAVANFHNTAPWMKMTIKA